MGLNLINNKTAEYYHELLESAKQDLSLAHIKQHVDTAQSATKFANIDNVTVASYSSQKLRDTIIFDCGYLTGKKSWVSNIPYSSHAVLAVQENNNVILVLAEIDTNVHVDMISTLGMENTYTGHITFEDRPAVKLFDYNTPTGFQIKHQISLGFLTNHYGLCQSLYNDIDLYTQSADIDCNFEKSKIKLNISTLELVWNTCLTRIGESESDQLWHHYNTAYAFAKQTLNMILKLIIEVTGSGLFEIGSIQHQRFKDALIYSSHMKNLYFSSKEHLY